MLGVLVGVDIQGFSRPEGSEDLPSGFPKHGENTPPTSPNPAASTSKPSASTAAYDSPMQDVEEDDEDARSKKEAEAAKKAGSEAYKKRDWDEAAKLFEKAWDIWPKDIVFLTNLSGASYLLVRSTGITSYGATAVYFEQGNYDKAIETCEKAVEEGRSVCTDISLS